MKVITLKHGLARSWTVAETFALRMLGRPARGVRAEAAIRRILIIKWSALGDVAIATSAMSAIRGFFPAAQIHLNTLASAARLFEADPRFDDIFVIDVRERGRRWQRNLEWLRRVRAGRYDLVIDLQRTDHTRLLLAALLLTGHRIKHRVGLRGGFPYTEVPAVHERLAHAHVQAASALQVFGIDTRQSGPVLFPPRDTAEAARRMLTDAGLMASRFLLLLPGSQAGGWLKRWGSDAYARLALLLLERGVVDKVAVLGGPEEIDECIELVRLIEASSPATATLLDRVGLSQISEVAAHAAYIVGNDTGSAHIAAAARRPMLVLCGPTDPARVKPIGKQVRALQAEFPCLSCYRKTCTLQPRPACLAALSPQSVADVLMGRDVTGVRIVDDENVRGATVPMRVEATGCSAV